MKYLLLLSLLLLVACAPSGLTDKDTALVKGASDSIKALTARIDAQQKAVDSLTARLAKSEAQGVVLQKQVADLAGKLPALATKTELAAGQPNLAEFRSRLSQVEGRVTVASSQVAVFRQELSSQITALTSRVDSLAALFQGQAPVLAILQTFRAEIDEIKARMAAKGW